MPAFVQQIRDRIAELDKAAEEVSLLAEGLPTGTDKQPELSIKGQQWYRGIRELMVQHSFSGLGELEDCYRHYPQKGIPGREFLRSHGDMETFFTDAEKGANLAAFRRLFLKARALVSSLESELVSRELPVKTALSLEVAATEIDTAQGLLDNAKGEEVFIRVSGVIARVALERHLLAVSRNLQRRSFLLGY
jgi:hypothetical protein